MNILAELTRHLVTASRNVEPKTAKVEEKTPEVKPIPKISQQAFMPSLLMPPQLPRQPLEMKPSLESLADSKPDLGKINDLASDPSVSMIVCDGPMKAIRVRRSGKLESTAIALDRIEIDSIVDAFSKKSRIPPAPVFRSKIGNISILALISQIETRFMLTIDR